LTDYGNSDIIITGHVPLRRLWLSSDVRHRFGAHHVSKHKAANPRENNLTNQINAQWSAIPPEALWLFSLAAIGWIVGPLLGFYFGRRSQKEAAKLKARNDALAAIDSIVIDIPKPKILSHLFSTTKDGLKQTVISFSCQVSECRRLRIEKALDNYQALHLTSYPVYPPGIHRAPASPIPLNTQAVEQERKMMLEILKSLRDEISVA
jgi:hypothetical protein